MRYEEFTIEGRNAVIEAYRAGRPIDKLFILDGCQDGPILTIKREAKAKQTPVKFVTKERLDQLSETGKHQGVIAYAAAYEYATVEEILDNARQKGEAPFLFLLDNIEDPHNLGAIIRSAESAGAHGVIIPKRRSAGLTAVAARASARAEPGFSRRRPRAPAAAAPAWPGRTRPGTSAHPAAPVRTGSVSRARFPSPRCW